MTHLYDSSLLPLSSCSRISLSVICTWLHSGWTGSCVTKIKFSWKGRFLENIDLSKNQFLEIYASSKTSFFWESWSIEIFHHSKRSIPRISWFLEIFVVSKISFFISEKSFVSKMERTYISIKILFVIFFFFDFNIFLTLKWQFWIC